MFDLHMDVSLGGLRDQADQVRKTWSLLCLVPGTYATRQTGVEGVQETDIMRTIRTLRKVWVGAWLLSLAPHSTQCVTKKAPASEAAHGSSTGVPS